MKQKWFISCIGAAALALAAIAFTGCTSPAGSDGNIRLQFNEAAVSAMDGTTGKSIPSGAVVTQGQTIKFTAKILREDGVIDNWQFGTKKVEPHWLTDTQSYTVDAEDGNRYQLIEVTYNQRDKKEYTISFDADKIECKKWNNKKWGYTDEVASGTKLLEGTHIAAYVKDAKTLFKNEKFAKFSLNDSYYTAPDADHIRVTVYAKRADNNGKIAITYEERNAKKFKVTFDDTKIECKQFDKKVEKDTQVLEGYPLVFTAKDDKEVKWKAGQRSLPEHQSDKKYKSITVVPRSYYLNSGSNDTITVSYTE